MRKHLALKWGIPATVVVLALATAAQPKVLATPPAAEKTIEPDLAAGEKLPPLTTPQDQRALGLVFEPLAEEQIPPGNAGAVSPGPLNRPLESPATNESVLS